MKTKKLSRTEAIKNYAYRKGVETSWILEYKSVVPAELDCPCDYPDCEGWHFLPKGFYTQQDVDAGFVPAEILKWL